jgi:phosphomannomutase
LHYGRDALVGIALFLSHLSQNGKSVKGLRMTYPDYTISKNKIELDDTINLDLIFKKIEEKYIKQPINKVDGLKIEFGDEWVHLRRSNTEPIIRIYSESQTETMANNLADKIKMDIKNIIMG